MGFHGFVVNAKSTVEQACDFIFDREELIFKVGFVMEGWANESLRLNQVHGVDQVFTVEGNRKRMANSTNF